MISLIIKTSKLSKNTLVNIKKNIHYLNITNLYGYCGNKEKWITSLKELPTGKKVLVSSSAHVSSYILGYHPIVNSLSQYENLVKIDEILRKGKSCNFDVLQQNIVDSKKDNDDVHKNSSFIFMIENHHKDPRLIKPALTAVKKYLVTSHDFSDLSILHLTKIISILSEQCDSHKYFVLKIIKQVNSIIKNSALEFTEQAQKSLVCLFEACLNFQENRVDYLNDYVTEVVKFTELCKIDATNIFSIGNKNLDLILKVISYLDDVKFPFVISLLNNMKENTQADHQLGSEYGWQSYMAFVKHVASSKMELEYIINLFISHIKKYDMDNIPEIVTFLTSFFKRNEIKISDELNTLLDNFINQWENKNKISILTSEIEYNLIQIFPENKNLSRVSCEMIFKLFQELEINYPDNVLVIDDVDSLNLFRILLLSNSSSVHSAVFNYNDIKWKSEKIKVYRKIQ